MRKKPLGALWVSRLRTIAVAARMGALKLSHSIWSLALPLPAAPALVVLVKIKGESTWAGRGPGPVFSAWCWVDVFGE